MEHEREENYTWAPEKLSELFTSEEFLPKVMVTNWGLTMVNSIEVVFPFSFHILCVLHISKNVGSKCKEYLEANMKSMLWINGTKSRGLK